MGEFFNHCKACPAKLPVGILPTHQGVQHNNRFFSVIFHLLCLWGAKIVIAIEIRIIAQPYYEPAFFGVI